MAHTYTSLLTHVVFSTKDREPLLSDEMHAELGRYLYAAADSMKAKLVEIGGVADHVHLLADMPASVAISDLIGKWKSNTSHWIEERWRTPFSWQRGYGAFSVSRSEADRVIRYIRGQKEHHRKQTFKEEFLAFLDAYEVEYDPEYVWR